MSRIYTSALNSIIQGMNVEQAIEQWLEELPPERDNTSFIFKEEEETPRLMYVPDTRLVDHNEELHLRILERLLWELDNQ